ncbi:MAG: inositol monophosphatase [Deltaproteobacteria bacterium]|nr:MAG: inositol monophosphatase [Deltaproteobacteria bacterium]
MLSAPPAEARALAQLLERAGNAALERFGRVTAELKGDGSEVTEADKAASEILVEGLAKLFPGVAVISEEGEAIAGSGGRWYVDPIDGTAAFLERLPTWGPTVCLVDNGALAMGALHLPRVREHWFAGKGRGAWRDERRMAALADAQLTKRHSICVPSRFHNLPPFGWKGKVRCLGSSAIHLAQVAAGGSVATVIPFWELWDVGAGILLIEEVGGRVQDLAGHALDPVAAPKPLMAGSAHALDHLTPLLASLSEL